MTGISLDKQMLRSLQDTSTNGPTTIHTGSGFLRGVLVRTGLSAHEVVIKDDTTEIAVVPASSGVGTWIECGDMPFDTSLVIDPDDSSTGDVTVVYAAVYTS